MLDIIAVVEGRRAVEGAITLSGDAAPVSRTAEGRGRRSRRRTSAFLRRVALAIEPRPVA